MISDLSQKEFNALRSLTSGDVVRRSSLSERLKLVCDGSWVEAGLLVKQEVGYNKFNYCARRDRLPKFREVAEQKFPGFLADAEDSDLRLQGEVGEAPATPVMQKDGVVLLRDFSGVIGGQHHLDDLQSFRLSTLEKTKMRFGMLVLTVESMESFLHVVPNKHGMPAFDVAIHLSGNPSERLLQWLSGLKFSSFTHYGNFDVQGMSLYQRMVNWCPKGACRLFKPTGLEQAFVRERASGKGAVKASQARPQPGNAEIDEILLMIDRHGGVGVGQEVFDTTEMELEIV